MQMVEMDDSKIEIGSKKSALGETQRELEVMFV